MVRLLVEGSDAGASLFDWMTTGTKRFLARLAGFRRRDLTNA